MNIRLQNQLNMVGACLSVAQNLDYKPMWEGKPPLDFTADMGRLQVGYAAASARASHADAATGGASDSRSAAQAALQEAVFAMARALANHYKKTNDLDRLGKVDLNWTEVRRLRPQELVSQATAIRDLANGTVKEDKAADRGITPERVAALTESVATFSTLMNAPREQIVNRATLLRGLEADVAALVELLDDMDDLVIQFNHGSQSAVFADAWRQARMVLSHGHGRGSSQPPAPAPTPAPDTQPALAQ